jgi:hypothetical protein
LVWVAAAAVRWRRGRIGNFTERTVKALWVWVRHGAWQQEVTIAAMENPPPPSPSFRKLPARYAAIVLPLLLSCIMTFLISGISTLRGVGFAPGVLQLWLGSWGLSWLIAFPTLLVVMPVVRRLTSAVVETPP